MEGMEGRVEDDDEYEHDWRLARLERLFAEAGGTAVD